MNILFLTSRLPYPPNRGDKLRVFNFLSRLSKKHSITLLSFIESEKQIPFAEELKKYCNRLEVVLLKPWQSYVNCLLNILSPYPLQVHYYESKKMQIKINAMLKEGKFDAIYAHLFRMVPYIENIKNIRCTVDLCDAVSVHMKRTLEFKRSIFWPMYYLEWKRIKAYEKRIAKDFDNVLLISEVDKEEIMQGNGKFRNHIKIVPNGVEEKYFITSELKKQGNFCLVFLGYLDSFYNLDAIFYFYNTIFPIIKRRVPNVKFSIVGADCPAKLKSIASDKSVELCLDLPDIRDALSRATVFVCPLRVGSGLQNKTLQAMAMGLPVVTTTVGYEGLSAVKNKEIFVADDPRVFAKYIIDLLRDEKLRNEIGINANNFIRNNYSWEDSISKLEFCLLNGKKEIE